MHQGGYISMKSLAWLLVSSVHLGSHVSIHLSMENVFRCGDQLGSKQRMISQCPAYSLGSHQCREICWKGWLAQVKQVSWSTWLEWERTSRAVFDHLGRAVLQSASMSTKLADLAWMHLSMIFCLFLEWIGTSGLLCVAVDPCERAPHLSNAFAKRCLLRFVYWRAAAPSAAASSK